MRQQSVGKETQQRTVRIRAHHVDGIDDAARVEQTEQQDEGGKDHRHAHMRALAQPLVALALADVHTVARGQRRERTVGTRERGRHNAQGEQHQHHIAQQSRGGKHGQQLVASLRQGHALTGSQQREQHAQREEQQVSRHEGHAIGAHVLLSLAQRLAGEVLLHHVLVQSGHHNHDEDTAQELFPEVLARHPVVHHEDARVAVVDNGRHSLRRREPQGLHHLPDDEQQGREHTSGLQRVGPHQRLDAAAARVEPDERHHAHHRQRKRDAQRVEHEALQDDTHHIEPGRRTRHLRQQEEPRARLVRPPSQPVLQISIDGGEVHAVVDRQQDECHRHIAQDEAQARLQVRHVRVQHHAGHADKCHPRYRRPHHAKSHHIPRRLSVAAIERIVVGPAAGQAAEQHQQGKIDKNCNQYHHN